MTATEQRDAGSAAGQTRKVVINACYGGFSLSARGVRRMAELQGRECYFFVNPPGGKYGTDFDRYQRVSIEEAEKAFMFTAFDTPEAPATLRGDAWHAATEEERKASNDLWERHQIDNRDYARDDANLVRVVEELGDEASGSCAELRIREIPADVEWEIEEYDGLEHIAETHRTWR